MQYNAPLDQLPANPNASYIDGVPAAGIQGSIVSAASIEFDQREVVEVITRANVRGYADFTGTPCAIPSNADQEQLRKAIEGFIVNWQFLIDTALTFRVHGPGADFPDLVTAMEYLLKYRFGKNGSVTLQLAAGTYTYVNTLVTIGHPQNDHIGICGAPMKAPVPISSSAYAQNGNSAAIRANDTAVNLAMLRTKFATELHFTNGGAIVVDLAPLAFIDGLLLTGDGTTTGVSDAQLMSWTCPSQATSAIYTQRRFFPPPQGINNGIACVGGGYGFTVICGGSMGYMQGPMIALGNAAAGIIGNARSFMNNFCPAVISLANGSDGLTVSDTSSYDHYFAAPTMLLNCNGGNGLQCTATSVVQLNPATGQGEMKNNAGWGIVASLDGNVNVNSHFAITGNTSGAVFASSNSQVLLNGSTYTGTLSPAANTVGNGNSLINT